MKKCPATIAVLSIIALAAATLVSAAEQPLKFLHLLQQNGYGDMAVGYLEILAARPDLPQEVRDVWDLEMANSLMVAAADAFDARDKERLLKESREHLAKFVREKPNHPATAMAAVSWGDFLVKRASELIRQAKSVAGKDDKQREKCLADARADLLEARYKFRLAEGKFQTRLAELPPLPKPSARRSERDEALEARTEAETDLQETQLQLALIEYYLAQTYSDPKSDEHAEALKTAAAAFDDIYQRSRKGAAGLTLTGLKAHAWSGKIAEESGDFQLALDIYDEVLANAPDPGDKGPSTGLEPLYAQVEYYKLLILAKQKPEEFFSEAAGWLKLYHRLRQTDGYQAIALELAKATFALAGDVSGPEKARRISETLRLLKDMAEIRSPYQHEALLLRRDVLKAAGRSDLVVGTFDEAVALGKAAAADAQWEQARQAYNKALEIAEKTRRYDPAAIAAVREDLIGIQAMTARDLLVKGKFNECIEMAHGIVFEDAQNRTVRKESNAAALAAALAVEAALKLYERAPQDQRADALGRLTKLAEFTEKNWPDKPEADDARMARGQAKLVVGQVREAIDVFERVNPKSARYGVATCMAGQYYWRLYVTEKLKPDAGRDAKQMAADRAKAVERLSAGLEILKRQARAGGLSQSFIAAQALLAEIRSEGGDAEGAAALYQPLIDALRAERPKTLDETTLRIFVGAVRAYCAMGDLDKAGRVGETLIDLGPDTPQVNAVLVDFAKLLNEERKRAAARVTELESTTYDAELKKAKGRLASVQALLGKTLVKLAARREVSLAGMVFVGDALNTVGMAAEAGVQYRKIIGRAESDPEFAKVAEKAVTRVRAHLAGLLRKEGKFEESLKQVEVLLKDHPNSLELLMEKGLILQDSAEKDPIHFGAAVAHWVDLRKRLQALRKKPPEYYDVTYNVAACLVREAESAQDKPVTLDRARKAEQVLRSALILSPKLNGPDTVERYRTLLKKAIILQGRSPEQKGGAGAS
jgi:tetratricopeptide (TPR) repeat protein